MTHPGPAPRARVCARALATLAALALAGCAFEGVEPVGTAEGAIVGGDPSGATQDAVVLLAHWDPKTRDLGLCTATLVAPNLVLTARHCVARTDPSASCTALGQPTRPTEARVFDDHDAATMLVFVGRARPDFAASTPRPDARGSKLFVPASTTLCNADLALVLLDRELDAPVAPVRLDHPPVVGHTVTAVGWGATGRVSSPQDRQQRRGVRIQSVGATITSGTGDREFLVGESICTGDSGGPALAEPSGAVVGVVSRGGNAGSPSASSDNGPAATCVGGRNVYTQLAPFAALVGRAFTASGHAPRLEGEPTAPVRAAFGQATVDGTTDTLRRGQVTRDAAEPDAGCTTAGHGLGVADGPRAATLLGALVALVLLLAARRSRRVDPTWAPLAILAACGSRTGLPGDAPVDAGLTVLPDGAVVGPDGGVDARADLDALPPIDVARPPDAPVPSDCPDSGATVVYLMSDTNDLLSWLPPAGPVRTLGKIACPSEPGDSPFSMAVDRRGTGFVLFQSGNVFRISTANTACTRTAFVPDQLQFASFGMGFAGVEDGGEALYVVDNPRSDTESSRGLAQMSVATFRLAFVGAFGRPVGRAELTGTGDGRLFGFYLDPSDTTAKIAEFDRRTARVVAANTVAVKATDVVAFAFATWGGDFYVFTAPGARGAQSSDVRRYRPADRSTTFVMTMPARIVGAGVSTCAPQ